MQEAKIRKYNITLQQLQEVNVTTYTVKVLKMVIR